MAAPWKRLNACLTPYGGPCTGCHAGMICLTGDYDPFVCPCENCSRNYIVFLKKGYSLVMHYVRGLVVDEPEAMKTLELDQVLCRPPPRVVRFVCTRCQASKN